MNKIKENLASIVGIFTFVGVIIAGYSWFASAEDVEKLEKKIESREAIQKIKDINQDIELARAKEKAGFEGQEDLIRLLEQQKKEILLEQGIKD